MPPDPAFSTRSRRSFRALGVLSLLLSSAGVDGCVDTRLPDLAAANDTGPTAAAWCSADTLVIFPPDELRVHVIDVGQGDAIWVQTPWFDDRLAESRNVLIDAGPSGTQEGTAAGGDVVVDYLHAAGLASGDMIDALVVTHAHDDHFGGVEAVASAFDIGAWVDPGVAGGSMGFLAVRAVAEAKVAAVQGTFASPAVPRLAPGVFRDITLFGPSVEATLLWSASTPPGGDPEHPDNVDVNNMSVALGLRWAGRQLLLLGDIEATVEAQLIAAHDAGEIDLRAAFLKVAHHGSASSTSSAFLQRVFPTPGAEQWAAISSGRRHFGGATLPDPEVVARLSAVLPTYHLLSTESGDEAKRPGTEHGDDHILVRVQADGYIEACYVP